MNLSSPRSFITRHHRLFFYLFWLILALIQSRFTELQDDEAYYWVYSKYPEAGYFDHPPMTAMLIKMGYALFQNELGVRLFPLLLNLLSILLMEKLIERKDHFLFYGIILSIAFFQLAGFMSVPDSPLIFFTSLFFLWYKRFRNKQSLLNTFLLALSIVFLFYTKYHGLLIVFFVVLSDWKILKIPRAWTCAFIVLVLYSPHLLWEWEHNWVSFRYHLFESNVGIYKISYTLSYLAGLLLLSGPLIGFILIPAAFLYKPGNISEKAMKWVLGGFYIFFFISSFRGEVEPNWTSPALVPLVILSHNFLKDRPGWMNWLFKLVPLSLMLILFTRIIMIGDILPIRSVKQKFHAWKEWPAEMKKRTKGLPIVFSNSYQRASKYWFYSGQTTYSLNHVRDHMNNYNFWPIEDFMIGHPVYFLDIYDLKRFPDSLKTPIGYIGYRYDSSFNSFARIKFIPEKNNYSVKQNDSVLIKGKFEMSRWYWGYFSSHHLPPTSFKLFIFKKRTALKEIIIPADMNKPSDSITFFLRPPFKPGSYKCIFSVEVAGYNPTHNSDPLTLTVH